MTTAPATTSTMVLFAATAGAGTGLGLLLLAAGLRPASRPAPWAGRLPRPSGRFAARLAAATAAGVLAGALTGWPVGALLTAGATLAAPTLLTGAGQRTANLRLVEAVAGWAEMLRDTIAGAAGLEQAITLTAPIAPPSLRPHVVALTRQLEVGARLPAALREFADTVADPTCDLFVAALLLAADHQTRRLGDLLTDLAAAAREQAGMRLRIEAGRARSRTSVRVILTTTIGLAVALTVLSRSYLTPYNSAGGQLMLLAVGALFGGAFWWLTRMTRPQRPARLLTPQPATSPAPTAGRLGVGS